jgi:hypothetical protein
MTQIGNEPPVGPPPPPGLPDHFKDEQSAFKMVLEQYNKHLGFIIEMDQKCIGLVLAYGGLYYALHKLGDTGPVIWVRWLILVVSLFSIGFFLWMQWKYFERCRNCADFLVAHAPVAHPYGLSTLGILNGEHKRIIILWTAAFLAVFFGLLLSIFVPLLLAWLLPSAGGK